MDNIVNVDTSPKLESKQRVDIDRSFSHKYKLLIIGLAFALGIVFDILFYDKNFGVSYPIFTLLLIGFFVYVNRDKVKPITFIDIAIFSYIMLLSLTYAIFNNMFFKILNFMGIPVLICIFTLRVTNKNIKLWGLEMIEGLLSRIFHLSFASSLKPIAFLREALQKDKKDKNTVGKQIIIGLLVSVVLLSLILPMLISADMAFKYYLENVFKSMEFLNIGEMLFHIILVCITSLYFFGYAWSFKHPYKTSGIAGKKADVRVLEPTVAITVLIVINLIYLVFTVIQFSFLYAGASKVLPDGLTYAEYARNGFFDLVTVTVINLMIVLCAMKFIKETSSSSKKAVRLLLSVLVLFTVNLLVSAFYRMSLYEQAYGYTELRIYVFTIMVFLTLLFIMVLMKLWNDKMPLLAASIIIAAVMYIGINYMNVEAIIARNNINRYYETGKIDINYLKTLSVDAAPEVALLAADSKVYIASVAREILEDRKQEHDRDYKWMEYNYYKSRVRALVSK